MTRDFVTVDYFSHHWDASDLGCASQELKRQISQVQRKIMIVDDNLEQQHNSLRQWGLGSSKSTSRILSSLNKDKHRLLSDEYRLARLENISWRQFKASHPKAPKIDPIDINWQKNSDVIWLYGPLFRRDENDTEFEKRLGCITTTTTTTTSSSSSTLKPALSKRNLSKEEYVERILGKNTLKKYKRRSFPVDHQFHSESFDFINNNDNNDDSNSRIIQSKRKLRFKPDVLEFIYHADVPLQMKHPYPSRGRSELTSTRSSKNISSAAQRAKALLLAARSKNKSTTTLSPPSSPPPIKQAPIMPPSPPLSPSDEGYIKVKNSNEQKIHITIHDKSNVHIKTTEQAAVGWWSTWSFYSVPPVPEETVEEELLSSGVETIPGLCANLVSLSAEVLTLMGTVAIYKGVSYGLGCPTSQQQKQ
ncbi:hypothetical protein INT45_009482 [Circinella minor]|uniref:Nitrogen regulatory protein areA GATA-like domain-containing protein n=1 Tax=Circinella minor TaxID=1195481 RepID=A0A8H7SAV7_9FUNG|nr:hypothetical protein INT45_009482 [Circinella minor]